MSHAGNQMRSYFIRHHDPFSWAFVIGPLGVLVSSTVSDALVFSSSWMIFFGWSGAL
jgi:hypothetical protein